MEQIRLTIDGKEVVTTSDRTILEAAREAGVRVPSLCYEERMDPYGACRICLVEVEGARGLLPACYTKVTDGMVVRTVTEDLLRIRRTILELILSDHPKDCMTCESAGDCELQDLAYEYGVKDTPYKGEEHHYDTLADNPLIERDYDKCILCGRCIRICREVQGVGVYDFVNRGFEAVPGIPYNKPMTESPCEFCGQCVSTCPTGAIVSIPSKGKGRSWQVEKVRTTCPYCGCGCQLDLHVREGRIIEVSSAVMTGPGEGNLCVKGRYGYEFVHHPDRLSQPLVRKGGELVPATWEEALGAVANRIRKAMDDKGPDSVAFLASARCTNEENYLLQKLARAVVGTNNVDHCARLCHASTVAGLAMSFGSGAMTNSIEDLEKADCILVTGSNTTEGHPIIGLRIKRAVMKNGCRLIVAEPRHIRLCYYAQQWIRQRPGTDVALFNAMMNVILSEGLADEDFIRERTEGFEEFRKTVEQYTPERAAEICGVDAEEIRRAARTYATAERAAIVFAMGITQHTTGVDNVLTLANLAMLTGNLGKEGAGVNPLRGQNNVQGACDMGALPNVFPGYQAVSDAGVREKFERAWGADYLSGNPGLTVTEIMDAAFKGDVDVLYIMGENPMISDPDISHLKEALEKVDFLVVQDIFLTETAAFADVVLPSASFAEKEGTFTNTDRRVQRVRKAVEPPGEAREDSWIIAQVASRLGSDMGEVSPAKVMEEIASLTPSYGGISYARLEREGELRWPCPDAEHPGTPILHVGKFTRGKGLFKPVEYRPPAEEPDDEYPLVLTTGRLLTHYHTGTMTRRVEALNQLVPSNRVWISPADAERYGVADGEEVGLQSRRGAIRLEAKVTRKVAEGVVFVPFHFGESPANALTNPALDPVAKIPELKVAAVRLVTGEAMQGLRYVTAGEAPVAAR